MIYLTTYKKYNESKGISDTCVKVLYDIWTKIKSGISEYKSSKINITINEPDLTFNLNFIYDIERGEDNICNGLFDANKSTIKLSIVYNELNDEFMFYIKSTILHELIHLYQFYNINKGNKFRPESFSIGSIIPQLRKNIKTKYVNYLLDLIYFSLEHEISAQIHQYYLYRRYDKDYQKLYKIKNILNNFKYKELVDLENSEINFIKKQVINSLRYYSDVKFYKKDIKKSIWFIEDNNIFLSELNKIFKKRIKWIDKKINLIEGKLKDTDIIYETVSLPSSFCEGDVFLRFDIKRFIEENLNDCVIIHNI